MESGFISNEQITASSHYIIGPYSPWDGRLNNNDYWSTAYQYPSDQQWIQVDFLDSSTTENDVIITGIQTQGSDYPRNIFQVNECWVKSLQIQTGNTTEGLEFINEEGTRIPKVNLF